jgi:hypothetical protein
VAATNPKKGLARLDERLNTEFARALNLGTPALAAAAAIVADVAAAVGAYTILSGVRTDLTPSRNVTVTMTQAGGVNDTVGTVTVTGTNVEGDVITEAIVPVIGSTVAGTKAFATVTGVSHAGWVAGGTADRITVGWGTKIGLPASGWDLANAVSDFILCLLGGVNIAATYTWDTDEPEKNTVDASSGTYNGTKRLTVLVQAS